MNELENLGSGSKNQPKHVQKTRQGTQRTSAMDKSIPNGDFQKDVVFYDENMFIEQAISQSL